MNSHIFSFVECGHRVSKHHGGITVNLGLQYKSIAVVCENYTKMLQ